MRVLVRRKELMEESTAMEGNRLWKSGGGFEL
jgi:hypothetical protein